MKFNLYDYFQICAYRENGSIVSDTAVSKAQAT